ncbi:entericidin A/B family lipoprotein [Coraliomargarita sp. SDUM461004]|uniref:Entericidin A/B family lipoprotein n=1 Tax=Thalassobacterium sedimentorum TaxID=3041258 RepID=A0ABU1ADP3_9BACT|nr:entericidin A/B family lipoprotein [Coraliomargarita sp. SDUM461004]MDQ8192830.1 entericidin A/B family lipoprotein [Coraliomargarita sp. SDUM461004]
MKHLLLKFLAPVIVLVSLAALSGCNTMKGLGQDVESLGESIQNIGD